LVAIVVSLHFQIIIAHWARCFTVFADHHRVASFIVAIWYPVMVLTFTLSAMTLAN
jgi:hypothetical protein